MADIDFELISPTATQANDAILVRRGAAAPNTGALILTADMLSRANHTGTQEASTITGLASVATSGSASDLGTGTLPAARLSLTKAQLDTAVSDGNVLYVGDSITASTISDFSEAVDDRVAALVVAGTNMTITYNDAANTLTFDAAGGGGGVSDGDKGDITVSGTGTVWRVDPQIKIGLPLALQQNAYIP